MTTKIYGIAASTCTGRVLCTLFEKEVTDYELVPVNIMTGEQKKPEFMEMQPFGKIPVMKVGPLTMFESRAICRVLSHRWDSQGTKLFGVTPLNKALVENWLEVESQNYNPPLAAIVVELCFKPMRGGQTDQAVVDANMVKFEAVLDVYEHRLSKSKKGEVIEKRPHVKAWWDDISSRPSWKKVCEMAAASLPKKT